MKIRRYTNILMLIGLVVCSPGSLSADESDIELQGASLLKYQL